MSTISKFPLFKLPILCIEDILLQSHSIELINFSFLSKTCHRLVKSLRTPFEGLYINVTKDRTLVQIVWNKTSEGNWYFNCGDIGKDEQITRSIGGCEMKTCIKDMNFYSHVDENIQMSVKAGIEYLMDLFKLPVVRVVLRPDDMSQRPLLVGLSECEQLLILGENQMDHDELRNIIEQFKCTKFIFLYTPIDESFYCADIKSKRITIEKGAKWVKSQHLFHWKFAKLTLFTCSLKPNELELFVKNWLHSNETDFEYMSLKWKEPIGEFNFKSLPLMPWSENRRSHAYQYNENHARDCSGGMDFFRNDGLLATILIRPNLFVFCVWHTRFHDLTGLGIH